MKILTNGSKWMEEEPDTIETLIEVLKTNILDREFEKYGNFVMQDEEGYRLWGNFLDISHVFNITGTWDELEEIIEAISENQSSKPYINQRQGEPCEK